MSEAMKKRNAAYRREMDNSLKREKLADYFACSAHLALDDLKQHTNQGIEPSEADFEHVTRRFEYAIAANEEPGSGDLLGLLGSRLTLAYIRPIVWADILNKRILKGAAARRSFERVGLDAATEAAYTIADGALELHDELRMVPTRNRSEQQITDLAHVTGFLGEVTPLLFFGGRHRTSKLFATPSLAYDDMLSDDLSRRVDVDLYDNRSDRTGIHYPFQLKTWTNTRSYDIPVLNQRDFGNNEKSSYWPHDDELFTTLRMLIREHDGLLDDPTAVSTLDRIASKAFRKISTPPEVARMLELGNAAAYAHGQQVGKYLASLNKPTDQSVSQTG